LHWSTLVAYCTPNVPVFAPHGLRTVLDTADALAPGHHASAPQGMQVMPTAATKPVVVLVV
jgi:hypothetical protein